MKVEDILTQNLANQIDHDILIEMFSEAGMSEENIKEFDTIAKQVEELTDKRYELKRRITRNIKRRTDSGYMRRSSKSRRI